MGMSRIALHCFLQHVHQQAVFLFAAASVSLRVLNLLPPQVNLKSDTAYSLSTNKDKETLVILTPRFSGNLAIASMQVAAVMSSIQWKHIIKCLEYGHGFCWNLLGCACTSPRHL